MRYSVIRLLTALILAICVFFAMLTMLEHVLFYQEQHHLFLFSGDYFRHTLHWKGFMDYIAAFMVQFYYWPWLGSAIMALMLAGICLMIDSIIFRLTGKRDFFQIGLLVAVALFFTFDGLEESPAFTALCFVVLGIVWVIVRIIFRNRDTAILHKPMNMWQTVFTSLLAVVFLLVGLKIETKFVNEDERDMLLAEKAVRAHDWDTVLDITDNYLSTGKINRLIHYYRNIALAQKGVLVDHVFDFPRKINDGFLVFPWTRNTREIEQGHKVHEITGDINAAHHWAFEGMTVWGETSEYLGKLGEYNVLLGRPEVARKFADKLGQSLFYKKEAEKIRREAEGTVQPAFRYVLPDSIEFQWLDFTDFRRNLALNCKYDPDNGIARQYLLAALMISGNPIELISVLRPDDLRYRNIRQAVLLYSMNPSNPPLESFGLAVDPQTEKDYRHFLETMRRGNPQELKSLYGNSFWYYVYVIQGGNRK